MLFTTCTNARFINNRKVKYGKGFNLLKMLLACKKLEAWHDIALKIIISFYFEKLV